MSTPEEDIEASLRDEILAEPRTAADQDEDPANSHGPDQGAAGDPAVLAGVVQPTRGVGMVVTFLLGLFVATSMAGLWAGYSQLEMLASFNAGDFVSDAAADANDDRVTLISLMTVGATIMAGIAFLVWIRRAYGNLSAWGYERERGAGWSIGAWFVPILNFFRPFTIVREIYCASDPDHRPGDAVIAKAPGFMSAWWAAWLLANLLGRIETRLPFDSIPEMIIATQFSIFASTVSITAAVLAGLVVHRTTKRQTALIERLTSTGRPTTF